MYNYTVLPLSIGPNAVEHSLSVPDEVVPDGEIIARLQNVGDSTSDPAVFKFAEGDPIQLRYTAIDTGPLNWQNRETNIPMALIADGNEWTTTVSVTRSGDFPIVTNQGLIEPLPFIVDRDLAALDPTA